MFPFDWKRIGLAIRSYSWSSFSYRCRHRARALAGFRCFGRFGGDRQTATSTETSAFPSVDSFHAPVPIDDPDRLVPVPFSDEASRGKRIVFVFLFFSSVCLSIVSVFLVSRGPPPPPPSSSSSSSSRSVSDPLSARRRTVWPVHAGRSEPSVNH